MFGIGITDWIVIAVIALLIFGPSKLPELGKTLGKGLREFRNASSNLKDQINPLSGDSAEHTEAEAKNNLIENKKTGKKKPARRKTVKKTKASDNTGENPSSAAKPKKNKTAAKPAAKKPKTANPVN